MKNKRKKILTLSIVLSLLLTACGSQNDNSSVRDAVIDKDAIYLDENKQLDLQLKQSEDIVSYAIGGEDALYFKIDATKGFVTFKVLPDYEIKTIYKFNVIETDKDGKTNSYEIVVRINDIDEDTTQIGYITDSGIEGLNYKTSSGIIGVTGYSGKYYFLNGDSVFFKLGNVKLGNEVTASQTITPMALYSVEESSYKNDTEIVNLLRFLQTLDSDAYHNNGIKLDVETVSYFETIETIDFSVEESLQNILLEAGISKQLIDADVATTNMDITLSKIDNQIISSTNERYKLFYDYSKNYFLLKLLQLDDNISNSIEFAKMYIDVVLKMMQDTIGQELINQILKSYLQESTNKDIDVVIDNTSELLLNIYNSSEVKVNTQQLDNLKELMEKKNIDVNEFSSNLLNSNFLNEISLVLKLASTLRNKTLGIESLMSEINSSLLDITSGDNDIESKSMVVLAKTFLNEYYNSNANPQVMISSINEKYGLELDKYITFENIEEFDKVIDAIAQRYTDEKSSTHDKILSYIENPLNKEIQAEDYNNSYIRDEVINFISQYNSYYDLYQKESAGFIQSQDVNFTYSTITSKVTGKVWMDRNLGASRVCQENNDTQCFGDYYQWGRKSDGHEKQYSAIISTLATTTTPNNELFIVSSSQTDYDWTTSDKNGLTRATTWNICPSGFRVPTLAEVRAEEMNNDVDAFNKLKLPLSGYRFASGFLGYQNSIGNIWTSNINGTHSYRFYFSEDDADIKKYGRAVGFSVRCIQ